MVGDAGHRVAHGGLSAGAVTGLSVRAYAAGAEKGTGAHRSRPTASRTRRKLDFLIIGVLAVAVTFFTVDKFPLEPAREHAGRLAAPLSKTGPAFNSCCRSTNRSTSTHAGANSWNAPAPRPSSLKRSGSKCPCPDRYDRWLCQKTPAPANLPTRQL